MQPQIGLPQRLKKLFKMGQMVSPRITLNDNIVDVSNSENPLHAAQERVHHSLKGSRARSDPKVQSTVLALAIGSYEAGFGSVLFLDLELVEPMTHIHDRKVALALKGRQYVVRTRKRLCVCAAASGVSYLDNTKPELKG